MTSISSPWAMTERQLGNLGLHLPDPVFLFGGVILTRANQTNESLPPSTHTHHLQRQSLDEETNLYLPLYSLLYTLSTN